MQAGGPDGRGIDGRGIDGRAGIDAALVKRLLAAQFPEWAGLPVTPVEFDGWDNRTYRLGETMTVRLPTAAGYAPAIAKEHEWLPRLAAQLPVAVPPILGLGVPGEGFPFHWSVRGWLEGRTADRAELDDLPGFAAELAAFLLALQACGTTGAPDAGEHSWFRGTSPAHYDDETRRCLSRLSGRIDTEGAEAVWDAALDARWGGPPVWFHGDVAAGNLLEEEGSLAAVIDFGTSGVGDPACDLVIAWTLFGGESRSTFRREIAMDEASWARGRGWALWKALLGLAEGPGASGTASNLRIVRELIEEHRSLC